jgi:putative heme-binding domain-containing protein
MPELPSTRNRGQGGRAEIRWHRKKTLPKRAFGEYSGAKKIDPKFVSYLMETAEGQVHSGLLEKRTAKEVVLKDASGKQVAVQKDEIELLVPQQKSLMPELLLRDLTAEQAADLIAFLVQLK